MIFGNLFARGYFALVLTPNSVLPQVNTSKNDIAVLTENDVLSGKKVVKDWQMSIKEIFK